MINIKVENMTDLEIIESNIEAIDKAVDCMFKTSERMFKELDKGEVTTELKLLTNIGTQCAAIKICHNKLESQLGLLKELQEEKVDG